ncbi:MAG: DUF4124 domain-containing protein [Candidatus Thiodiazotropha sp. (ex Cardiolucina cf. quadrata)]|nr:DUF4124 domain-containing protein [Candidatus Thiodiazotropha sp. (ex Cardiolucina cf. quadrata)]
MRPRIVTPIVLFILFLPPTALAGKLYKWVDDKGQTHYTQTLPPTDAHRARSHLDEHGIVVKEVDAAKTEEELRQEAEQERLRQEQQRLVEQQQSQDRVLLRTFRSEDDILMTRDGQLQAVDTSVRVTQANIKRLKTTLEEMQQDAAKRELQGRSVPKRMLQDIEIKRQALEDAYSSIIEREHDKNRIRQSFARDLKRFRELKKLEQSDDPIQKARDSFDHALQNVYHCQSGDNCEGPWQRAKAYLKAHSTTPIKIEGDNIVITGEPIEDDDISISVSRIDDPKRGSLVIFMDLQCKIISLHKKLCANGEAINRIKLGFRNELAKAGDLSQSLP